MLRRGKKSETLTDFTNAQTGRSKTVFQKSQNFSTAKVSVVKTGFQNKNFKKSTKTKVSQEANALPLHNRFTLLQNTVCDNNIAGVGLTASTGVRTKKEKIFFKKEEKLDSVHITDHGDLDKVYEPPLLGTAELNGSQKDHGDLDGGAATLHNRLTVHGPLEVSEIQTGQLSAAKKYQKIHQNQSAPGSKCFTFAQPIYSATKYCL